MKPQFITDAAGRKTGVILSIKDYDRLMDELDEAHTIRLYDKAKAEKLTFRPLNDAFDTIDNRRNKRRVSNSDQ
ncbi:MAG: hypothetical protein H7Z72_25085 [Bacteroidetes bacterium]|nr:hypothetical protein [Fibrella sp.]